MGEVAEVKKEDIFKRETRVSNPWLDPNFSKVESLGREPGFKVDDIPERLGLLLEDEKVYLKKQFVQIVKETIQTEVGQGFWSKAGSTVYYKTGKVAIGHAAAQTILHISTPLSSEIRIQTSGEADPTLSFKTTNTAHQINFYLDESATNDHFYIEGKTAGVNTRLHIIAVDGKVAGLQLYSGVTNYGALTFSAADNLNLKNSVQDKDLIFGIKDGAVEKTITWDADVDKLKHSAGLFDFDNDNLQTSGYIGLRSNAEVRFYDNGNYVGFEAPALTADQIWVLPSADGPANEAFGTDGAGNLIWRTHDELAGFVSNEHLATLDEDNMVSDSDTNVATQQSIKAYADNEKASKTTATWNKSIGSGGDYANWATMIQAMPNLIAHQVTVTIKTGTTLTGTCNLKNKHGITVSGDILIAAEKYFPTSTNSIPTADGATATTLNDTDVFDTDDEYNNCWVKIVDGTGTDNGYVAITDTTGGATNTITVAAWPGTEPDNTSKYIIVGALVDGQGTQDKGLDIRTNTCPITFKGIGIDSADNYGVYLETNTSVAFYYCGFHDSDRTAIMSYQTTFLTISTCGIVNNNTDNHASFGGIRVDGPSYAYIVYNGISDNSQRGIFVAFNAIAYIAANFGDGNGAWGTYCQYSGQALLSSTECSGSGGNHNDPGTAGNANADQAAAY